jgi:hypothetical protein
LELDPGPAPLELNEDHERTDTGPCRRSLTSRWAHHTRPRVPLPPPPAVVLNGRWVDGVFLCVVDIPCFTGAMPPRNPVRADIDVSRGVERDSTLRARGARCSYVACDKNKTKGPCPPSFLVTVLLFVCTCTYVKMKAPQLMDAHRTGLRGLFWKAARIGERLSPWVAVCCICMSANMLWVGGGK